MRLLLDTCVLLWMAGEPSRLSNRARELLTSPENGRFVSAITAFEIAIKVRKRKLDLPLAAPDWFREVVASYGFQETPITSEIALLAPTVAVPHADPCDRMIAATAQIYGFSVVTPDPLIQACKEIEVVW